jgi:hypothetical protein
MKFLIVEPSPLPIFIPNILLKILFSNNPSLRSSLNVRDHVSQPYSTTFNPNGIESLRHIQENCFMFSKFQVLERGVEKTKVLVLNNK